MWEIEFYELPGGRCPVENFLSTLDERKDLPYIMNSLDSLAEFGYQLKRPHADYLRDKIYELRINTRNGQFRLLYFYDGNKIIITSGLKKKIRATSDHQIDIAIGYRELYLKREKK